MDFESLSQLGWIADLSLVIEKSGKQHMSKVTP